MKQAHIDAEDFKGVSLQSTSPTNIPFLISVFPQDPEKNVPGAVGIRLSVAERRKKEKAEAAAVSTQKLPRIFCTNFSPDLGLGR